MIDMIIKIPKKLYKKVKSFFSQSSGSIYTIFAITIVPTLGLVGAAMDYSRASMYKSDIAAAADAAVLAGTKLNNVSQSDRQMHANKVFDAHFTSGSEVTITSRVLTDQGNGVQRFTVQGSIPNKLVTALSPENTKILKVATEAIKTSAGGAPLEFVIAFDITNSMGFSPQDMNKALGEMSNFIQKAYQGMQTGDVIGSVVPFSDRVRFPGTSSPWVIGSAPNGWPGCLAPRHQVVNGRDQTLTDDPPALTPFEYHVDFQGHSPYYTAGCHGSLPTLVQTTAQPLMDKITTIRDQLGGSGRYDEAMSWTWRLLSPRWNGLWGVSSYPKPYSDRRKLVIFVSDGRNELDRGERLPLSGVADMYGHNQGSKHGFLNLEDVCTRMKNQGIEIAILQTPGNDNASQHFQRCSSNNYYFLVQNIEQFKTAVSSVGNYSTVEQVRLIK
jgi:Flp pilus assembly protein TadG